MRVVQLAWPFVQVITGQPHGFHGAQSCWQPVNCWKSSVGDSITLPALAIQTSERPPRTTDNIELIFAFLMEGYQGARLATFQLLSL